MTDTVILDLPTRCRRCRVGGSVLCRAVAGAQVPGVHPARSRSFAVSFEGDTPQFLGVLRRGYLRKETMLRDGQRTILGLSCPGDLVGGLLGRPLRFAVEAATDAEVCVFDASVVDRMLAADRSFKMHVLREASAQNDLQLEQVWRRGALNSRERIIAFLVMAAEIMPTEPLPDGGLVVRIDVSRRDWADLSNTTVETISRTMRYLADKDMVTTRSPGHYLIRDLDRLALLAGMDRSEDRALPPNTPAPMTAINANGPFRCKTGGVLTTVPQRRGRDKGSLFDDTRQVRH